MKSSKLLGTREWLQTLQTVTALVVLVKSFVWGL